MALPEADNFEALLKSLTLHQPHPSEGKDFIVAVKASIGFDRDQSVSFPEYKLWYSPVGNLTIDALISKIQNELRHNKHAHSREVTLAVLCLYTLLPAPSKSYVDKLNSLLSSTISADLTQVFVLPVPPPPGYEFRFGSFTAGTLNAQRLSYRCRKVKSDGFDRYESRLRGKLAYERDIVPVILLDWIPRLEQLRSTPHFVSPVPTFSFLIDVYFHEVASELQKDFWAAMLDDQHVTIAMGANYVNERELQLVPLGFFLSIFMNIGSGKYGYVMPSGTYQILDLAGTNKFIPETDQILRSQYNFAGFGNSVLHQTTKSFARFVSRARRHIWADRSDEGFLHFVIALDLLLTAGSQETLSKTVSERAAVLVHRALGKSYQDQKKSLSKIYSMRSKYVHEGKPTDDVLRTELERVCTEVFLCLMRLQTCKENHEDCFYDQWLKDVDYVAHALEAGRSVPESELEALGVQL